MNDLAVKEEVSLTEMNELAASIARLRAREDDLKAQKTAVTEELEAKEQRVIELLMANDLTNYKAPDGLMSVGFRTSVRQPVGDQVPAWTRYLVDKFGSYEGAIQAGMLTTNSQKLNAFYKEQMELAKERGEAAFEIPGLTEVKMSPTLSFRKNK